MIIGLIGLAIAFYIWAYSVIQERLIEKRNPKLNKLDSLQKEIPSIDREMNTSITFRQVVRFPPSKLIQYCANLYSSYQWCRKQQDILMADSGIEEAVRKRNKVETYYAMAGILFLASLITFKIGTDFVWPPLRYGRINYWKSRFFITSDWL
jgi:hypothetical protein